MASDDMTGQLNLEVVQHVATRACGRRTDRSH